MSPRPRTFSNDEVLQRIREHDDPFITASDLASKFEVENGTILDRLHELEKDGEVLSKKVGARATVWYLPSQH